MSGNKVPVTHSRQCDAGLAFHRASLSLQHRAPPASSRTFFLGPRPVGPVRSNLGETPGVSRSSPGITVRVSQSTVGGIAGFTDARKGASVFGDGCGDSIKGKLIKTEQAVAWGSNM